MTLADSSSQRIGQILRNVRHSVGRGLGANHVERGEAEHRLSGRAPRPRHQRSARGLLALEQDGRAPHGILNLGQFVLLDYEAGHGVGSTKLQRQKDTADIYTFLLWQLGHPDFQPAKN